MASSQTDSVTIGARIDCEHHKELETIAYQKSEPGDYETVSSIVREAVAEYIERHD